MTSMVRRIDASDALVPSLIILAALGFAILFGLAVSTGQIIIVAVLAAPLGFLALIAQPLERLVWLQFAAATVLGGTLAYFGRAGQAQWLPIGVGGVMYLALSLRLIRLRRDEGGAPVTAPIIFGAAFLCVAIISTAWAAVDLGQWLYGLRYYFAMASLLLVLALLPLPAELLSRLWVVFLAVVLLQLPVALYQYLIVAGRRVEMNIAGAAWDAIVGTMGGSQEGGGHSAAMGFFALTGLVLVFALWKREIIRAWQMVGFAAAVLGVIFLAEVKFMVVLLPIAVALVLRLQFVARIKQLMMGAIMVGILALAMPILYSKLHYERIGRAPITLGEFYQRMIVQTETDTFNSKTGQMGRVGQIAFWWREHSLLEQPKEFLIGHGVGATNQARMSVGTVARQYFPLPVSNTGGVILLWEVGTVGLGLCVVALVLLALRSLRLSTRQELPIFHRGALEAGAAVLMMLIPALFYRDFALKSPAVQFVLFLAAGQVCYWQSRLARDMRMTSKDEPSAHGSQTTLIKRNLLDGSGGGGVKAKFA